MNTAERMAFLFAGRNDVYGAVEGRCVREPLTVDVWQKHLSGHGSVGVYPLVDGEVHWGCTDIDEGFDMLALAVNVWKALKVLGIRGWVEKSKGKGYHVWVFLLRDVWVPAADMRAALMVAHQLADVRPKEVNPKQITADELEHGLGNYVNAPYCLSAPPGRRVMLDMERSDRAPMTVTDFLDWAERGNPPEPITAAAALYVPPPPPKAISDAAYAGDLKPLVERMSGLPFVLFRDGPLPSLTTDRIDRSAALMRFAHLLKEDGFTADEALALLIDFDSRLGKFVGRPDAELQLRRILGRAY